MDADGGARPAAGRAELYGKKYFASLYSVGVERQARASPETRRGLPERRKAGWVELGRGSAIDEQDRRKAGSQSMKNGV